MPCIGTRIQQAWGAVALTLIIDDDGFYRGLIERTLGDEGHQVLGAHSAVDGIASYQERRPDLVITDMRMPSIGGAEVRGWFGSDSVRVRVGQGPLSRQRPDG